MTQNNIVSKEEEITNPTWREMRGVMLRIVDPISRFELASLHIDSQQMFQAFPSIVAHFFLKSNSTELPVILQDFPLQPSSLHPSCLPLLQQLLQECQFSIPNPPKVNSNSARDFLAEPVHKVLHKLSFSELQQLYRGSQFLGMENLKKSVAVMIASYFFVENFSHFKSQKQKMGIKKEIRPGYMQKLMRQNSQFETF